MSRIRPERVKKEAAMPFYLRPLEPPIIVLEMQEALPDVILHRDRKSIMPYLWHFYLKNNTEYTRCLVDLEFRRMALHFERGSIFSLAVLPSNLLERIITKLQYVSFFRLQQTCKDIGEIVQVNKNINVYLRKQFKRIFWKDDETGESKLCGQSPDFFEEGRTFHGRILKLNFESIYGVRFPEFPFPEDMDEVKFNEFCDFLKKYRITSSCLSHRGWYSSDAPFTTEQYVKLLNILKPSTVDMSLKDDPNHFEACLQAFHTKNRKVTFSMSYSHTPEMLKRLLFGPMSTVRAHCLLTTGEFYEILISVLEVLRLGPRISSFLFYALIEDEDEPPSVYERDIEEFLMDCESILVPTDDEDVFDFLPFPDGSTGQLILNRPYIVIYWNRNV